MARRVEAQLPLVDGLTGEKLTPRRWLVATSLLLLAGLVVIDVAAIVVAIRPGYCENDTHCGSQAQATLWAAMIYLAGVPVLWTLARCVMRVYLGGRRLGRRFAGALTAVVLWTYQFLVVAFVGGEAAAWGVLTVGWLALGALLTVAGARRLAAPRAGASSPGEDHRRGRRLGLQMNTAMPLSVAGL